MEEAGIVRRGINTCAGERGISCELEEPQPLSLGNILASPPAPQRQELIGLAGAGKGSEKNALLIIPLPGGIKKVPMLVTKSKIISSLVGISK